jgi:hypothetical protein
MRVFLAFLFASLLAMPADAQWFARGNWTDPPFAGNDYPLVDSGDGVYFTGTVSGLFPDFVHQYKISNEDFSISVPTDNGAVRTNGNGEINFHFWDQTTWDDGWMPNDERRVGYDDSELFDWEIAGNFNDWNGGEAWHLTDQGNGLHTGQFPFDAGLYEFKFRQQGLWDISIGNGDFSNFGANNPLPVANDGDLWNFELDLPNGRWRAYTEAAPPGLPGDYNQNGSVDAADYTVWRDNLGGTTLANEGDGISPGMIDNEDYAFWKSRFGAAPSWVATGTFGTHPLVDQGGGEYTVSLAGLTPATDYEFKIARDDLSESVPGSNVKVRADAEGDVNLNFFELQSETWADGWSPVDEHRVGYEDHGLFDWEVIGSFNMWPGSTDPNFLLTDQGNGLHTGQFTFNAGEHLFKFRHQAAENPWNVSIGDNFGNSAADNTFTVSADGEQWAFELDLPNGRWRAYLVGSLGGGGGVPEPSAMALALLSALTMCLFGRRVN